MYIPPRLRDDVLNWHHHSELDCIICSLYHRTIDAIPGQLVFARDMIFNMLYTPGCDKIREGKESKRSKIMKERTKRGEIISIR